MNQSSTPALGAAPAGTAPRARSALVVAAVALPPLVAYAHPPSPTAMGQIAALLLWGLVLAMLRPRWPRGAAAALAGALAVVLLAVLAATFGGRLPGSLAWPPAGLLATALLLALGGAALVQQGLAAPAIQALAAGLLAAGLGNAGVAAVQVFAPDLSGGFWIAATDLPGRAIGNLRHSNHLALLLLWALVCAVLLAEVRRWPRAALWIVAAPLVAALQWTGSRFGLIGLAGLAAWALSDRRLSSASRVLLVLTPLLYGAVFALMAWWGTQSHAPVGTVARVLAEGGLAADGDSPNSRLHVWRNALALIAAQPLAGVGFGEFNLAWTLSALPQRPSALFDHAHNLLLQLAVELGLPLAALVLGLLAWALVGAARPALRADGAGAVAAVWRRPALVLLLLVLAQSQLEHPLWFAYFLLPTALLWGLQLGTAEGPAAADAPSAAPAPRAWCAPLAGGLVALGGLFALLDYHAVAQVFRPAASPADAVSRLLIGQRSLFFAHWADHAAALRPTTLPSRQLALRRAPHALLDPPLLAAWATHLAASGELDRARWLAQQLRALRQPYVDDFFAVCSDPSVRAFQCTPPTAPHDWRELADTPIGPLRQVR